MIEQNKTNKDSDIIEIDLLKLAKMLWSNITSIVLVSILTAALTFAYSYFMIDPQYEANCKVYVNSSTISLGSAISVNSGELSTSMNLVPTYIVILEPRTTLNEVIKQADLDYTYSQLLNMISASSVSDTAVFNISVKSTDPDEAKLIANTIAEVLPDKVSKIIDGTSVRIVDYAVTPVNKISPSITKNTAIGFMIGFLLACAYLVVRDLLDDVIHDEDILTDTIDLPILGVIPDLDEEGTRDYYYYSKKGYKSSKYRYYNKHSKGSDLSKMFAKSQLEIAPTPTEEKELFKGMQKMLFSNMSFSASEAYKLLRTNLSFVSGGDNGRIIGVTSSTRGEGKSTTSLNLSYSLAETGKKVLTIDGDLRIPTLGKRLGIDQEEGLSSVLAGLKPVEDIIASSRIFSKWYIIPAGVIPPNPNELLGLASTRNLLQELAVTYDYVIVDLPPVNIVADALTLAGAIDDIIIVARQDYSSISELKTAVGKFNLINIKPIGLVFTDVADRSKGYKYTKYRKYGSYKYRKDRYKDYGYSTYYDKKAYPDPRIYAMRAKSRDKSKEKSSKDSKQ